MRHRIWPATHVTGEHLNNMFSHCASDTKQYNLLTTNERWCLVAGKVLATRGFPPMDSRPRRGRWAPVYAVLWSMVESTLPLPLSVQFQDFDLIFFSTLKDNKKIQDFKVFQARLRCTKLQSDHQHTIPTFQFSQAGCSSCRPIKALKAPQFSFCSFEILWTKNCASHRLTLKTVRYSRRNAVCCDSDCRLSALSRCLNADVATSICFRLNDWQPMVKLIWSYVNKQKHTLKVTVKSTMLHKRAYGVLISLF